MKKLPYIGIFLIIFTLFSGLLIKEVFGAVTFERIPSESSFLSNELTLEINSIVTFSNDCAVGEAWVYGMLTDSDGNFYMGSRVGLGGNQVVATNKLTVIYDWLTNPPPSGAKIVSVDMVCAILQVQSPNIPVFGTINNLESGTPVFTVFGEGILSPVTVSTIINNGVSDLKDVSGNVLPLVIGVAVLLALIFWIYRVFMREALGLTGGVSSAGFRLFGVRRVFMRTFAKSRSRRFRKRHDL